MDPKVAIICMTYNHKPYISEAVASFVNQDFIDCDFLIFDDCSNDCTYYSALSASSDDSRIKVFKNDQNLGAGLNSKKAVMYALKKGYEYIGFCEGDDYLVSSKKLSRQVDFLDSNPDASLVFCAANIIEESGELIRVDGWGGKVRDFSPKEAIEIGGNLCATATTLYRAEVLRSLPVNFYSYPVGDYPLQVLASFSGRVVYLPFVGAAYRQASISSWTRLMVDPDKYIANHEATLNMLDELNEISFSRFRFSMVRAKFKYWYFLAVNTKIRFFRRLSYVFFNGGLFAPLILVVTVAPLFNVFNEFRRIIVNRFFRRVR